MFDDRVYVRRRECLFGGEKGLTGHNQHEGRNYQLRDEVVVIGRDYNCDILIDEPAVSRVHALICRENGNLVIEDLGRKSGTRVNQVAIRRKVLSNGDQIQIGRSSLVFRYNEDGQSCPGY